LIIPLLWDKLLPIGCCFLWWFWLLTLFDETLSNLGLIVCGGSDELAYFILELRLGWLLSELTCLFFSLTLSYYTPKWAFPNCKPYFYYPIYTYSLTGFCFLIPADVRYIYILQKLNWHSLIALVHKLGLMKFCNC